MPDNSYPCFERRQKNIGTQPDVNGQQAFFIALMGHVCSFDKYLYSTGF
jgi:hypothetical protein